jgi:hypothetical protein
MTISPTPTPWDLSCHTYDGQQLIDIGTKTTTVAIITEGEESWLEDRANASFIIRACNAYKDLLDALEIAKAQFECIPAICTNAKGRNDTLNIKNAAIFGIDAALQKARGEA